MPQQHHQQIETRALPLSRGQVETRATAGGGQCLVGYAAVYYRADDPDTEFSIWAGAVERCMPGCFDESLARPDDIVGLFNHNTDHVLSRLESGTLRLTSDERGLRYEMDLTDDPFDRRLAGRIARGDIKGSSCGFVDRDRTWLEGDDGLQIRELRKLQLVDVGPVTYESYLGTSVDVAQRSLDAFRSEQAREQELQRLAAIRERRLRWLRLRR